MHYEAFDFHDLSKFELAQQPYCLQYAHLLDQYFPCYIQQSHYLWHRALLRIQFLYILQYFVQSNIDELDLPLNLNHKFHEVQPHHRQNLHQFHQVYKLDEQLMDILRVLRIQQLLLQYEQSYFLVLAH